MIITLPVTAQGQKPLSTDSLRTALKTARTDTDKVKLLVALARTCIATDVSKGFYYANSALNIADEAGWTEGKMEAEELIGSCYNAVKRYNDAIDYFNASIANAKKLNRVDIMTRCMQQMARSYRGIGDQQNMNRCQREAVDFAIKSGNPKEIATQMRTYGLFLSEAGHYRKAIDWVEQDINYIKAHFNGNEQKNRTADLLNIMAGAFLKLDNGADSAIYYLRIAERLTTETESDSQRAYVLSTFCDVYQSIKMYDSAIIYGLQTVRKGEQYKNLDLQQYYCKTLSEIFEAYNKPAQALYYHKKYDSLIDIIDNSRKLVDQAIQLSDINIEQAAELDRQEKRSFDAIRRNQKIALTAALAAVLAFIVLTGFIYSNLKQKQKANKIITQQANDLQEQNEVIDKALKEKEILLKETHHRVKNNLQLIVSLLELQSANLEDPEAKNALYIAQQRVLSIATVHSKLYGDYEVGDIDFSAFATELFNRLSIAFGSAGTQVTLENRIPSQSLALNTVVLLGLIMNELITNSFKHAFSASNKGVVKLELEHNGGIYTLRYYDSGPGLPNGLFGGDTDATLGLYLVRRLTKQLKGNVSYLYDRGSIFIINFQNVGN